jgi:hypothetical protein
MKFPQKFDVVKLIPKNRHAKNRVHEHGDIVDVVQIKKDSFCTMARDGDWRWIDVPDDRDFLWEIQNGW